MIGFDHRNPDYAAVYRLRSERLARLRRDPGQLPALKTYYRDHVPQFVDDWGCTLDPRLVERGLPALVPFVLFDRQHDWLDWLLDHWRTQRNGLTEKSRDMGLTWLAIAASCSLCLFNRGMVIGFGSRKEEYVDRLGDPKSLFQKARVFMACLPVEFRDGWSARRDAPHMRVSFPGTGSHMTGEAGDNIGRGDRAGIYFVDEAAYLERPERVEASLSQTTNCRMDISSARGMGNPFAIKRHNGKVDVFTYHWRDDPRKDDAWYAKQVADYDPIVVAQEIDIDYHASIEGQLIPAAWVASAVDAHLKLRFAPTGSRGAALDVADEGRDLNALVGSHGPVVEHLEEWSGVGSDILGTVQRAFLRCDELGYTELDYDADGLGAGVRGDARMINERRQPPKRQVLVTGFQGSGAVINPTAEDVRGRANEDMFANRKAQAWWSLRTRFQLTHRAVTEGLVAAHDDLISLPSGLPLVGKLRQELSQPTYRINAVGKFLVDKAPDGVRSPNLADGLMIRYAGGKRTGMKINPHALLTAAGRQR